MYGLIYLITTGYRLSSKNLKCIQFEWSNAQGNQPDLLNVVRLEPTCCILTRLTTVKQSDISSMCQGNIGIS